MAYTAPTTRATGNLVTASIWNTDLVENIKFLANPPACRVYHNANQNVNDSASTALAFNSERWDTDSMHDTATNNSRITINTAGLYVVTGSVEITQATDYVRWFLELKANGATTIAVHADPDPGTPNLSRQLTISTIWKFTAGNYIELLVFQDNTANVARAVNSVAAYSPEFSAVWLGLG